MIFINLIFIVFSIALLCGFLALTCYETGRGARFFMNYRARFDYFTGRINFIIEHVNFSEFIRDEMVHFFSRMAHGIAHFFLVIVRGAERLLTRLIRKIRSSPEIDIAPRETAREFVKTLSDFKDNLKAVHPEISDVK